MFPTQVVPWTRLDYAHISVVTEWASTRRPLQRPHFRSGIAYSGRIQNASTVLTAPFHPLGYRLWQPEATCSWAFGWTRNGGPTDRMGVRGWTVSIQDDDQGNLTERKTTLCAGLGEMTRGQPWPCVEYTAAAYGS
ncbi:hypothetical protein M8818_007439 [Zalaria obscura]|uniref:Uncharacterized protein n=1 Tax=Zalaria obscura TaxID=2024903 RepID=A0ACC3S3U2_9PEZI